MSGMSMKLPFKVAIPSYIRNAAEKFNISHLLLTLFALHLFALSFPNDTSNGGGRVFDEAYYVPAALDLLHGVPSNLEHPFFGKVWGALGIGLFGNNFFGWRILYAVIGVLTVWVLYELARQFFPKEKALLAASMLGFENIFFMHTSLLLLDGPPILFALLGFLAYFKKRYYLSAVAFGLSILSKETGVFFLLALALYHLWANRGKVPLSRPDWRRALTFTLIILLVVAAPLWAYDLAYHPYTSSSVSVQTEVVINPITNLTTTTTRTTTTPSGYITNPLQNFQYYFTYQSSIAGCGKINQWNCYPWMWILPVGISPLPYYENTIIVKTVLSNGTVIQVTNYHPIYWQGIGNLAVWYSIWLIVPLIIWKFAKGKAEQIDALTGSLIAATYLPLFYISLVTQRVEYAFYFINTDPGLAIGIPIAITFLAGGNRRFDLVLSAAWVAATVIFFLLYFPVNPFAFR